MGQRVRGRPASDIAFALIRAAKIGLQVDVQGAQRFQIILGRLGIMAGPEQAPPFDLAAITGFIPAKITKIANALKRIDSVCHAGDLARMRARVQMSVGEGFVTSPRQSRPIR